MFKTGKKEIKLNKSMVIIIEVCVAFIILLSLIGIKYLVTNKSDNSIRLDNQVISDITFSDFTISFDKEGSKVAVDLINYSQENIEIENVVIKLYAKDNTQISEITTPFQEGILEPNQSIKIENKTSVDLSEVAIVEYEIKVK